MGGILIVGAAIALVFLSISAYFCVRKRFVSTGSMNNRTSGTDNHTATYSVGYNVESNAIITETEYDSASANPDLIPRPKGRYLIL